ncbi:hypothetical protein CCHR01_07717 [Colletotrichum chrysophilum]|uniref:Uncharacterized protein n=1 Tax=Colletotrichum chrysophilum TaxID=1836956 RepID=A0AAD9EJF1_9PEZI|nr:hypothetical protein CCHR01_07717 [Colletotrichum chrysophilum]
MEGPSWRWWSCLRPGGGRGVKELPTLGIHGDGQGWRYTTLVRESGRRKLGTGACRQAGQDAGTKDMGPRWANTARGRAQDVAIRWSHRRDAPVENSSCLSSARQNSERHRCGKRARQSAQTRMIRCPTDEAELEASIEDPEEPQPCPLSYIQLVHRFIAVASLSVEYAAAAHICESGGPVRTLRSPCPKWLLKERSAEPTRLSTLRGTRQGGSVAAESACSCGF